MAISVSIVEDNAQLRGTLAKVIGRTPGFRFASDYGSAEDALALARRLTPPGGLIVATGSVFLVGAIREAAGLRKGAAL